MADVSRKGSLPYGWIVKTSKRYPDRIYYFNTLTGSSTWECPELDPPRVVPKESEDVKEVPSISKNVPQNSYKPLVQNEPVNSSLEIREGYKHENSVSYKSTIHSSGYSSISSGDDSIKSYTPPTAVVIPVVHENKASKSSLIVKTCNLQDSSISKSDGNNNPKKAVTFLKEQINGSELNSNTSSEIKKKKSTLTKKKKKKKSPLNKTDSELKKSLKAKKKKKLPKIISDSPKKFFEPDVSEKPKKSSFVLLLEENKDAEDIEMLDVSMDMIEDLTAQKETVVDTLASYYVVVDTNVLISELHLVRELKDTPVDGCGPPHIFIPWVVIEELDRLKANRNCKTSTIRATCEAIRYLNSVLGKHPRFHGQSPAEAEEWAKTYSRCNDDRILECCMGLADKMPQEKVILLTNDKNLTNKALICNINVHNWNSMMESVKPDVTCDFSTNKSRRKAAKEASKAAYEISKATKSIEAEGKKLQNQRDEYCKEIHTVMCTARQLLKAVLAKFLKDEMHEAYGPPWLSFPIKRNLLEGVLEAILRYWQMVFSEFMNENDKKNFELLFTKASRPEGFLADKQECLDILSTIETVFKKIKRRRPNMLVPIEKIQEFRSACVDVYYSYWEVDSAIKEAEKSSTLALFEKNWCAINQLCGMFMDFFGIEHDFEYDKPDKMPSEQEFRRLICNLYPAVEQLKTLMFNILNSVRSKKVNKNAIKKLSESLLQFIPSLEIPYEPFTYPNFSTQALQMFCYCPENKEMIEIGYKQIEKFYSKLDDALTAFMSPQYKKRRISTDTMLCD